MSGETVSADRRPRKTASKEDRRTPRWALREEREHEAGNPGPVGSEGDDQEAAKAQAATEGDKWDYGADDQIIFESANITSAASNGQQAVARKAKILAVQEHSVDGKDAADFKQLAKGEGWDTTLGPVDPEFGRKAAGVGFCTQKGMMQLPIKPMTDDYDDAVRTGRLLIQQWELEECTLQIGNGYGWTGGVKGSKAADRTNDLFVIAVNELDLQEPGPKMLVGDFNGELEDLPIIQHLLKEKGWIDVGSHAQLCDGQPNEPTCKANADAKANRRDFILVNDILYDAVKGFRVMKDDLFPTHCPVQVSLDLKKLKMEKRTLRKPRSAAEAFEQRIDDKIKDNKDLNENEVRRNEKNALHQAIDDQISLREWRMSLAVKQGNADKLWDLIAAAIENGFIKHLGLAGEEASKMRGRNVVRIRTKDDGGKTRRPSPKCHDEDVPGSSASDLTGPKGDKNEKKRWLSRAGKHGPQPTGS